MNILPEDLELIEAYIDDKLEQDMRMRFVNRLDGDESFKLQYEFVLSTQQAIRALSLEEKKAFLQSVESSQRQKTRQRKTFSIPSTIIAAAASLLIIAAIIFVINSNSVNQSLIDQQFIHVHSGLDIKRSDSSSSIDEKRIKAYSLYEVKSYKEAAPLLFELFTEQRDTSSLYFAGLSYLASYNLQKAKYCLSHPALDNTGFDRTTYMRLAERANPK